MKPKHQHHVNIWGFLVSLLPLRSWDAAFGIKSASPFSVRALTAAKI